MAGNHSLPDALAGFVCVTEVAAGRLPPKGGLRQTLLYCFTQFATGLEAFFGHCGDARAKEVDLAAGFVETEDPHLLVRWTQPLPTERRQALFSDYLASVYFPGCQGEHRMLATFTTEPAVLTEESERYRLPRFVCGEAWRSPEAFAGLLDRLSRDFLAVHS